MQAKSRRHFIKTTLALTAASTSWCASNSLWGSEAGALTPNDVELLDKFLKAVSSGNKKVVQQLLAADKSLLNVRDNQGRSGYALALLAGHQNIAKLFIDAGYESDLHEAALGLDWKRFDQLASDAGDKINDLANRDHPIGGTTMFAAAAGGAGTNIWRVYAKCCDPNVLSKNGHAVSPLQKAPRFPDLEIAELTAFTLLGNSTNPNLATKSDSPPLHIAVERGSIAIVEMLIRLGAELNAKDVEGRTALELAKFLKQKQLVDLLEGHEKISRTCQSSRAAFDKDGSPYEAPELEKIPATKRSQFVGSSHGNLALIKQLLKVDARLAHSVATTGEKAVEAGAHMGQRPIVELLLNEGAPYSLPTAVMMGDMDTAQRLLDEDPKRIHERGAHDFALLWYPVIGRCDLEMTNLLLDRGANVEQQHQLGTTALHWACLRDNFEVAELLVDRGADVNRVGRKFGGRRQTPLQQARDEKIIKLLKSNGAK